MPPADPHAADVDAIYLDKMRSLKPKYGYGGPVMRADPGIAHLDAAIATIAAKQNDILASNYRNSAELSELRAVVETLARSIAETNERVFNLRDQVLHPLTGALAEHGEKMTREFQHRSAVAVVHETAQIALPEIIDAVERRHEEQTAAREEMHREVLDALGGVETARIRRRARRGARSSAGGTRRRREARREVIGRGADLRELGALLC